MKKRMLCLLFACLVLGLCACGGQTEPPQPQPTPTPSATPAPTGLALWKTHAEQRFNMDYLSFADYWSLMCDELYGDSVRTVLSVLSFPEKDAEIAEKRAEFNEKYGADWHYEIKNCTETALSTRDCENFAAELKELADRADIIVAETEAMGDAEWQAFAESRTCSVEAAKKLTGAYKSIADLCRSAEVTDARELSMELSFTGSSAEPMMRTETDCVYEVNGIYVSEQLLDYTLALLNLMR